MSVKTSITNAGTNSFDTNTSNVKKLTIATILDVAPFNFSDEKGAITGFDLDSRISDMVPLPFSKPKSAHQNTVHPMPIMPKYLYSSILLITQN